jgi:hypothetical protein
VQTVDVLGTLYSDGKKSTSSVDYYSWSVHPSLYSTISMIPMIPALSVNAQDGAQYTVSHFVPQEPVLKDHSKNCKIIGYRIESTFSKFTIL